MQASEKECIFCRIIAGEIPDYRIWENENFIATLDIRPINDGHTLIIPKEHEDYVFDLPMPIYSKLFSAGKLLAPVIQQAINCKRVGMVIEGFGVPHAHLHLVPINHGNELDPHRAHEVLEGELQSMQKKLKKFLP